ncbi:MAG: hypothetical protein ACRD5H_00180 [Nitrososphaerales archaeon]
MITQGDFQTYWRNKKQNARPLVNDTKLSELTTVALQALDTDPAWSVIAQTIDQWLQEAQAVVDQTNTLLTEGPMLDQIHYAETKRSLAFHRGLVEAYTKMRQLVLRP